MYTNYEYEKVPLKKTSMISIMASPTIPPGKYRVAIGFRFEGDPALNLIEYLVCQMMADVQIQIEADFGMARGSLHGSAFFHTGPDSDGTNALILWEDSLGFELDVPGAEWVVADALAMLVELSPDRETFLEAQRFVAGGKKYITRFMMNRYEKFLSNGSYPWRSGLLS